MLLLVLGAAFYFLYAELTEQQTFVLNLESTATTQADQFTTVDVTIRALEYQLTAQAAPLADYGATQTAVFLAPTSTPVITATIAPTSTIETVEEEATPTLIPPENTPTSSPEATPETNSNINTVVISQTAPSITIITPTDGELFDFGQIVNLESVIIDPAGVRRAFFAVNGEERESFNVDDFAEFRYKLEWYPPQDGIYELTIGAINSEGGAMRPKQITVTVNTAP